MTESKKVIYLSYLLSCLTVIISFSIWLPFVDGLSLLTLFPLLGLLAFGIMWSHYVSDALRRWRRVPKKDLDTYFTFTSVIVLICLLLHPGILQLQLFLDGLGPPPLSMFAVYASAIERIAIVSGVIALACFLLFELHRQYGERSWWRFIRWANILAMYLIVWHGFTLGGDINSRWSWLLWIGYTLTLTFSLLYTGYDKQRRLHESI